MQHSETELNTKISSTFPFASLVVFPFSPSDLVIHSHHGQRTIPGGGRRPKDQPHQFRDDDPGAHVQCGAHSLHFEESVSTGNRWTQVSCVDGLFPILGHRVWVAHSIPFFIVNRPGVLGVWGTECGVPGGFG